MDDHRDTTDGEIERLRAWLTNIVEVYAARADLFTNDADCAGSLAARALKALSGATP